MRAKKTAHVDYTFEYEVEFDNWESTLLEVVMSYEITHEKNYGADADGNRGIEASWADDLEFSILSEDGVDITNFVERHLPDAFKAIEGEADAHVYEGAGSDDYEYDDNPPCRCRGDDCYC